MADPLQFSDLYGANGLGFLVGDTISGSETDRKAITNDAYIELANIRGYWRKRSFDYTSSSTPALTDGTRIYDVPTTSGEKFDSPYKLYYRRSGIYIPVHFVNDEEWLHRSATQSSDKGEPRYARLVQTSSIRRIELNRAVDSNFINSIGTLTLEYFIEVPRMVNDTDEPILPANYRHHIKYLAAKLYAMAQTDSTLFDMLTRNGVLSKAEEGKNELQRHDLTRTGRAGRLKPSSDYHPMGEVRSTDYQ